MKVLIACEESQRVCCAFRELGHEAYSCDIQEPSGGRYCDCNDIYAERAPALDKYYDKSKRFEFKEETR